MNRRIFTKNHLTTKNTINQRHCVNFIRIFCGQAWLILFILLFLLSGCSAAKKKETANRNGTVTRIISAAPAYTEIIAGLGLADRLIAVDKYSRGVEGVRADLPEIDFFYPDIEAISGLQPDIIISGEINTNGSADTPFAFFKRMNITVMELSTCDSIKDIYRDIIAIASALGVTETGLALVAGMEMQIIAVRELAKEYASSAKTSVYFEIAPAPNIVSFGGNTYLNEMIEIIGARNIFSGENRWFTPGAEAIISANPDVIFISSGNAAATETAITEIKSRPGFGAINAVRNNRVYAIDENSVFRSSQNITAALEEMYRAVYDNR